MPPGLSVSPVPASLPLYDCVKPAVSPGARLPTVITGNAAEAVVPSYVLLAAAAVTVIALGVIVTVPEAPTRV